MGRGRHICNTLKAIRKQIADANDIKYEPRECTHQGDCAGSCPVCEAEVRYLEGELSKRSKLGRAIALVGISAGMAAVQSCGLLRIFQPPLAGIPADSQHLTNQQTVVVDSTKNENKVLDGIVEVMPQYNGGQKALEAFITEHLKTPEGATVPARVIVTFTIEKDGSISHPQVMKSVSKELDAEALRVVGLMPKWTPGTMLGEPVSTKYTLPIIFKAE
ncbi:MAG: energy transducer TonB [Prevotella sp.]|nr:energy transducer TonB [Prevotella sp.]